MIKRFTAIGRTVTATCLTAAFGWGLVEAGFFLSSSIDVWKAHEVALTLGSIFGVVMLVSAVIGCVITAVSFCVWAAVNRWKAASPGEVWDAISTFILGPPGESVAATAAVVAAYAGVVAILLPFMPALMLRWSDFPGVLALVVTHGIGAISVGLAYRLAIRKWPAWRGHRWVFAAGAAGVAYYMVVGPIREMDPLGQVPFVALIVCVFGFAARVMLDDLSRAGGMPARLAALRGPMMGIGLALAAATLLFYPPSPAVHSASVLQTRLVSPAMSLMRLGLDLDGDLHSSRLTGGDCDGLDPEVNPYVPEIPANGTDDNCVGGDLARDGVAARRPELARLRLDDGARQRPDIIFITVDTLRDDHLGRRIDGRSLTPSLDRLAAQSVRFRRTYAPSTHTKETFPSVMTGQYPSDWHHHGLYHGLDRTLAEILGSVGYQTLAISSIPGLRHEIVAGFDELDNRLASVNRPRDGVTSAQTTELALARLDERDDERPLFLWVHYFDPHAFYVEEQRFADWLGRGTQARAYAHEVARTDEAIGGLLDGLEQRGYLDGSVLAMFSDHGESLGEHDMIGHVWAAYDEIVRVPLLLRLPGVEPGERHETISLIDLFPTLIEYLGIEGVEPRAAQSLMPLAQPDDGAPRPWAPRPVFIEVNDVGRPVLQAVVDGRKKLTFDRHHLAYSLVDLESDPAEERNLISSQPDQFDRLREVLHQWWDRQYNTARLEQKLEREERLQPTRPARVRGEFRGPQ